MQTNVIHDLPEFKVTSLGNGLAYELQRKRCGRSIFFQDEGAANFCDDLNALTSKVPCLDFTNALRYLWNEYQEYAQ